jgi:hypothetical protein
MENYNSQIKDWLKASGNVLFDTLPSGSGICRMVPIEPEQYWTGHVSAGQGSFKGLGDYGNWYGTSFDVCLAEVKPTGVPIYEYSKLCGDTPIWNMYRLPEPFLISIYNDRTLPSGQFCKSQFVVECLQDLNLSNNASGIYFPSRQEPGGVVVLNPHAVCIEILYTGQTPPGFYS